MEISLIIPSHPLILKMGHENDSGDLSFPPQVLAKILAPSLSNDNREQSSTTLLLAEFRNCILAFTRIN